MEVGDDGKVSILITNQMPDNYGITADQLHADALEFAPVMCPAVIQTMAETLLVKVVLMECISHALAGAPVRLSKS